ncbi:MAG TPA: ABC transporter ATP-binding protein [Propionibacteriaceae bacterium]|nr:ABC transporter ATP-binding protein [Propionibacteriaceae bacterium]
MIEVRDLTKRYADTVAVDDLSFVVRPGVVTGFLGPNGAGKSTTMRAILGLDRPTAGQALVDGGVYRTFTQPLRRVGALIESDAFHPSRSARNHLRVAAHSNDIPMTRVDELLEQVGLASVAKRRVKTYSLGMRQRLGIAAALLGDPAVLLFDEPVNGLDADGVRWVRHLVRDLAAEGRTVLVSSHLLAEIQQTADHLVVIGRGRLIADASTNEVLAGSGRHAVRVRTSDPEALGRALGRIGAGVERLDDGALLVTGASTEAVGVVAREADLTLHELTELSSSLEQVYLELTADNLDYVASADSKET